MSDIISISILKFFTELNDPRQTAKVLYPLPEIILVALCAAICGADSFVEMEEFGNAKLDFLRKILPFKNGIPSHDTFGAVFANIDSKQFNNIFIKWVLSLQKEIPKLVAIDGKTVRRSMNGDIPPIHIVSAWSSDQRLVLGQLKTRKKSNELTAIPELLSMLSLKGATVSIDAMGCQKSIAEKIIEKKADYLLAVKNNQPKLYKDIDILFSSIDSDTFPVEIPEYQTIDKSHGRLETRTYSIFKDIQLMTTADIWPKLQSIGRVQRICESGKRKTEETRYYISSKNFEVQDFADAVRGHWGIENSLHWVMDVVFRDDECRAREKNASANFVTLKHITLNMLKSLPVKKSMRVRRKRAGWDETFLYEALLATPAS